MDVKEFSLEFDLLYNNIMSNKAPGLSEYEKSLFLTQAQESIVLDIYSGKYGDSFERTEETTSYLNQLLKQETYTDADFIEGKKLDTRSVFITLPEDLWFKTGEVAFIKDESYKLNIPDNNNEAYKCIDYIMSYILKSTNFTPLTPAEFVPVYHC